MSEPAREFDLQQRALDERIDEIVAAHGGDWRAAIELLPLVVDARGVDLVWLCPMSGAG